MGSLNRISSAILLLVLAAAWSNAATENSVLQEKSDEILEELSDVLQKSPVQSDQSLAIAKREDNEVAIDVAKEDASKAKCTNLDKDDNCLRDYKNGLCSTSQMKKRCARTCMVCCGDFDSQMCSAFKKLCFTTKWKQRLRHLCPETCRYCNTKMPAPPPCLASKFGCCWDKKTFASGPVGSSTDMCPVCKNERGDIFCERFKSDCFDVHQIKGKQMRVYCPKTCKLCGGGAICRDHPSQSTACPQYKAEGLCESSSKTMSFWCEKTCGFCKCGDNPVANCAFLNAHRACESSPQRMKVLCPMTCGFCKGGKKKPSINSVTK